MSSSSNNSNNDKDDEEEFKRLRSYIQKCPEVPAKSRAIQAALAGLDLEWKRIERDAKLKRKFNASTLSTTTTTATIKMENERLATSTSADSNTTSARTSNTGPMLSSTGETAETDDDLMGEWQDVGAQEPQSSLLGARLAQLAVAVMAQHQVSVKTPLAAIALALHASLVSPILGLACTGVPETPPTNTTTSTSKGFAPPIRELPKGQLLPPNWDEQSPGDEIRLRYRKPAVGSVILTVTLSKDNQVTVCVTPTSNNEPPLQQLVFPIDDHVNLDSFQKALANNTKEGSILPALHYKALPTLLTNFANTMDVGAIRESSDAPMEYLPYVDATAISSHTTLSASDNPLRVPSNRQPEGVPAENFPPYYTDGPRNNNPYEPPTIHVFQPARPHPGGDFAGDLYPPGYGDFMDDNSGNLLGPNHPMFGGGNVGIGGGSSGFGMRPRFDPFGPPGGPQDPSPSFQPPRRRPPPGGPGEPNPDHLRPPNNLNTNNLFM